MLYRSTRGKSPEATAAEIIVRGIAPDGGLYVPTEIPEFLPGELIELAGLPYAGRALAVLKKYLDDFAPDVLARCVDMAWGAGSRFGREGVAPIKAVEDVYMMELWHGPTCAFKDAALQFLPHALDASRRNLGIKEKTLILVATSGDTGKAALEGFRDVPGTHCAVFWPEGGVSGVQRLQMLTQRGGNVSAIAVRGNFDDAQTGVKRIFSDEAIQKRMKSAGWAMSSANSINWGRLVPQIVYYVSAWCELYAAGEIRQNEEIDFVVPTGNFGNILSAWYARAMGLPVGRLICASNRNRVLTDFFNRGVYDIRRPFYKTISPSMDIIISSNLERLIYEVSGRNGDEVAALMEDLKNTGVYTVDPEVRREMAEVFTAGSADDVETSECIRNVYEGMGYLLDPHTAVGWKVWKDLDEGRKTVLVSTASPYKFAGDVLNALEEESVPREGGKADCERLYELTGAEMPAPIQELWSLPVLHTQSCEKEGMDSALLGALGMRA
jgi:threonine synthase